MTTVQPGSMLASLPARYSKFVAVLIGLFITYVSIYGWVWHLDQALIMIGTALGVYGVPNGPPPAVAVPVPVAESTTVIESIPAAAVTDVPLPEPEQPLPAESGYPQVPPKA